jgi:hypothetical protein
MTAIRGQRKTHRRPKAKWGIESSGQRSESLLSGKLVPRDCASCLVTVMAPAGAGRVICGTCTLKQAHNDERKNGIRPLAKGGR